MQPNRRVPNKLGKALVDAGLLDEEGINRVLDQQQHTPGRFGDVALRLGLVAEEDMLKILSEQLHVPLVNLSQYSMDPDVVRMIPESHARTYRAIALEVAADSVVVGMSDPSDLNALDVLAQVLPLPLSPVLVASESLNRIHNLYYSNDAEIEKVAQRIEVESSDRSAPKRVELKLQNQQGASAADAPTSRMVDLLFERAVRLGASDIHIEPDEEVLRIRTRVDGVLHERVMAQRSIAPVLASCLKTMAGLDVAEVRMPQDGSFSLNVSDRELDVRLSTMPIQDGESIVMRLLDQSKGLLSLEILGMPEKLTTRFRHQVKRPHGMVLVTGPTGSGKTTTIYAALNERNNPGEKIITVEDPVEYKLPRVNQVEINPQIGLDFNAVLRSVLRQDPDVILIGEIRDEESMDMGLRSAMTGHLVFSTLHTNDAVSTVSRMIEMGGQGYLLAATLKLVVAQRLVRRVCPHCQKKQVLEPYEQEWIDLVFKEEDIVHAFLKGGGCASCEHTGYRGRIGIFEVIEIDHELKEDLNREDMNAFEQHVRANKNYHSLIDGAKELLLTGATSVEEVMRVMDDVSL
ncbi:MAG: Flp pilus assembly complex ATPase component TadA [Gammaproteobacteria bacterium]|nr:Flp pilus assembly complex ATPase component TadA [Gammaproteobacteria bacterium]MBT6080029.1 Flp pilus assembly complex ATPase component TadA [Gammaproteobacteria bacterium]